MTSHVLATRRYFGASSSQLDIAARKHVNGPIFWSTGVYYSKNTARQHQRVFIRRLMKHAFSRKHGKKGCKERAKQTPAGLRVRQWWSARAGGFPPGCHRSKPTAFHSRLPAQAAYPEAMHQAESAAPPTTTSHNRRPSLLHVHFQLADSTRGCQHDPCFSIWTTPLSTGSHF